MGKTQRYFDTAKVDEGTHEMDNSNSSQPPPPLTPLPPRRSNQEVITVVAKTRSKRRWMTRKEKDGLGPLQPFPLPKYSKDQLLKHSRGPGLNKNQISEERIRTGVRRAKILKRDEKIKAGIEQAAGAEILLLEEHG